jgi:hypothetical protein
MRLIFLMNALFWSVGNGLMFNVRNMRDGGIVELAKTSKQNFWPKGEDWFVVTPISMVLADGVSGYKFTSGPIARFLSTCVTRRILKRRLSSESEISKVKSSPFAYILPFLGNDIFMFKEVLDRTWSQNLPKDQLDIDSSKYTKSGSTLVAVELEPLNSDSKATLNIIQKGDSLCIVFRVKCQSHQGPCVYAPVFMTKPQQSKFNTPEQIVSTNKDFTPSKNGQLSFKVEESDVVMLASDGLFANISIPFLSFVLNCQLYVKLKKLDRHRSLGELLKKVFEVYQGLLETRVSKKEAPVRFSDKRTTGPTVHVTNSELNRSFGNRPEIQNQQKMSYSDQLDDPKKGKTHMGDLSLHTTRNEESFVSIPMELHNPFGKQKLSLRGKGGNRTLGSIGRNNSKSHANISGVMPSSWSRTSLASNNRREGSMIGAEIKRERQSIRPLLSPNSSFFSNCCPDDTSEVNHNNPEHSAFRQSKSPLGSFQRSFEQNRVPQSNNQSINRPVNLEKSPISAFLKAKNVGLESFLKKEKVNSKKEYIESPYYNGEPLIFRPKESKKPNLTFSNNNNDDKTKGPTDGSQIIKRSLKTYSPRVSVGPNFTWKRHERILPSIENEETVLLERIVVRKLSFFQLSADLLVKEPLENQSESLIDPKVLESLFSDFSFSINDLKDWSTSITAQEISQSLAELVQHISNFEGFYPSPFHIEASKALGLQNPHGPSGKKDDITVAIGHLTKGNITNDQISKSIDQLKEEVITIMGAAISALGYFQEELLGVRRNQSTRINTSHMLI